MNLPVGSRFSPYGTPIHVSEVMLLILKETFGALPEGHPYRWSPEGDITGVLFDTAFNKAGEVWQKKPLVVVQRGSQQAGVTVIGDLTTLNMPTAARGGTNLVASSTDFRIVSRSKAEAEAIGELVFATIMQARVLLPRFAGVHMVDSVTMSPVSKFDLDDECFLVQVTMSFSMQYKWTIEIPVNLLQSITAYVNEVPDNRPYGFGQSLGISGVKPHEERTTT